MRSKPIAVARQGNASIEVQSRIALNSQQRLEDFHGNIPYAVDTPPVKAYVDKNQRPDGMVVR